MALRSDPAFGQEAIAGSTSPTRGRPGACLTKSQTASRGASRFSVSPGALRLG